MRNKLPYFIFSLILVFSEVSIKAQSDKIILVDSMINVLFPISSVKNFEALIDEQDKYPNQGKYNVLQPDGSYLFDATVPSSFWLSGWNPGVHEFYIDLGKTYQISKLCLYRFYSTIPVDVFLGEPDDWRPLLTDNVSTFYRWKDYSVDKTTRYLRFSAELNKGYPIVEIVIFGTPIVPDTTPPNAITNLDVANVTSSKITLSWHAPKDSNSIILPEKYDFRYASSPLTAETWNDALSVEAVLPDSADVLQYQSVEELQKNSTYYFGVRTSDVFGNISALSNIVSAKTLALDIIPPAAVTDLKVIANNATSLTLAFTSTGDDDLSGNHSKLLIKYSTDSITTANWDDAITFATIDTVGQNLAYQFTLDRLEKETRYYVAVKVIDEVGNSSAISNLTAYRTAFEIKKIRLLPDMVSLNKPPHRTAAGSVVSLVDEQAFVGDPLSGTGVDALTDFVPAWQDVDTYYPVSAFVNLGEVTDISQIYFYNGSMADTLELFVGHPANDTTPEEWISVVKDDLLGSTKWQNHHDVTLSTQYLKFTFHGLGAHIHEMLLYGYVAPDTTAPAPISDLHLIKNTSVTADVEWSATGDDGFLDKSSSFQLVYSEDSITSDNWDAATEVADVVKPLLPYTKQHYKFKELQPATTYFMAIRSVDDVGNVSELSNLVSFKTEALDSLMPNNITNLEVVSVASDAVKLQWSAVGDDGEVGIADRYQLRFSTNPITEANWESALIPTSIVLPDSVGKHQFVSIFQLVPNTTYFVAIKVLDEVPNSSPLSNVVSFKTYIKEAISQPSMDQLIGTNALISGRIDQLQAFGYIREYHNWHWNDPGADEAQNPIDSGYSGFPDNKLRFNLWSGYWNFDEFYRKMKVSGITLVPSLKQSVAWLADFTNAGHFRPVLTMQHDAIKPESYIAHGDFLFQYAARYGNTVVNDYLLKVDDGQNRSTGLNLLNYYENWNEPNNWWTGPYGNFSAVQLAAMTSADYDGHQGRIANTVGVRNADLGAKLVMGGLAGLDLDYIKEMKQWADSARGGSFPCDVINLHHYCNSSGDGQVKMEKGVSPEADSLKYRLKEIKNYIDVTIPGKEFWLTEFGWDTDPSSDQRCEPIRGYNSEDVQAMWLVRAFLEIAAAKVDRAAVFTLYDGKNPANGRFESCGLISNEASGYIPKPSWYYTYATKEILKSTYFIKEHTTNNTNVLMYEFASLDGGRKVYAVWCPTSDSVVVNNFKIEVPIINKPVIKTRLEHGSITGISSVLEVVNNKITVDVSEVPQFITFGGLLVDHIKPAKITDLAYDYSSNQLKWRASGDDSLMYMANGYEIRWSFKPIDATNWQSAQLVERIDAQSLPTYNEWYQLSGLNDDSTYYFAIVAIDESGNQSQVSNSCARYQKLTLSEDMLHVTSGTGNAMELIDEPNIESPLTLWDGGYGLDKHLTIDLGELYDISNIYFFRMYEKEVFSVAYGTDDETIEMGVYNWQGRDWNELAINSRVRYIYLKCNEKRKFPAHEIRLYGKMVE